jgi:hypothetical protein
MSSEPHELKEERANYYACWEAVEIIKAHELAAMTDERAREIIRTLRPFMAIEPDPLNGMGLVEQQKIFRKSKEWGRLQPDPAT